MPLIKEYNPATGRFNYRQEPPDGTKPVMFTGPVNKPVQVADGTVYDTAEEWIEIASVEHAGQVSHEIGLLHERDGHPNHLSRFASDYDPLRDEFHHTCDDGCGPLKRTPEQQADQFAERLRRLGHGDVLDTEAHTATLDRLAAMRAAVNPDQEG
jgi:hypothetical protein